MKHVTENMYDIPQCACPFYRLRPHDIKIIINYVNNKILLFLK